MLNKTSKIQQSLSINNTLIAYITFGDVVLRVAGGGQ